MTAHCRGNEIVELYFYDELDARERAEADAHFAVCSACRESLTDLRAIEAALASRRVDAPEDQWRGFMARLEERLDNLTLQPSTPTLQPSNLPTTLWRLAAALALVAGGALGGWSLSRFTGGADRDVVPAPRQADGAITDAGDSGLARARVVLAGLARKEQGAEWALERRMAATLLPEIRLIRQVAEAEARSAGARNVRGRDDLADVLVDVETLLLQASYADADDPEILARLRGMIDRRDVLMRLSAASGSDEPSPGAPRSRRGI